MSKYPKWVGLFTIVLALTMCWARAAAQQQTKISRIGIPPPGPISEGVHLWESFRQGLRELGLRRGQEHHPCFSLGRNKDRATSSSRGRVGQSQTGRYRSADDAGSSGCNERNKDNPDRDANHYRSSRNRACF